MDLSKVILLSIIQILHFFIDLFCMIYIFIFNPIYDIYYCGFIFCQTIHWALLKNECIVSYVEKKIIDPNYELGQNPKWIPHYKVFYNKYTKLLKAFLILGALIYIIFRNDKVYIKLICSAAIVLWIYLTYFYKKSRL